MESWRGLGRRVGRGALGWVEGARNASPDAGDLDLAVNGRSAVGSGNDAGTVQVDGRAEEDRIADGTGVREQIARGADVREQNREAAPVRDPRVRPGS